MTAFSDVVERMQGGGISSGERGVWQRRRRKHDPGERTWTVASGAFERIGSGFDPPPSSLRDGGGGAAAWARRPPRSTSAAPGGPGGREEANRTRHPSRQIGTQRKNAKPDEQTTPFLANATQDPNCSPFAGLWACSPPPAVHRFWSETGSRTSSVAPVCGRLGGMARTPSARSLHALPTISLLVYWSRGRT